MQPRVRVAIDNVSGLATNNFQCKPTGTGPGVKFVPVTTGALECADCLPGRISTASGAEARGDRRGCAGLSNLLRVLAEHLRPPSLPWDGAFGMR